MNSERIDIAIIGGGIVGLGTALALTERFPNRSLAVLEAERELASHQTGHNSGVIHAGIYYKPGSAKARLCVEGVRLMKQFCRDNGVPIDDCGKVIVAVTEDEVPRLQELYQRGMANGVPGLEMIDPGRVRELEPHARAVGAPLIGRACHEHVAVRIEHVSQVVAAAVLRSVWLCGVCSVRHGSVDAGVDPDVAHARVRSGRRDRGVVSATGDQDSWSQCTTDESERGTRHGVPPRGQVKSLERISDWRAWPHLVFAGFSDRAAVDGSTSRIGFPCLEQLERSPVFGYGVKERVAKRFVVDARRTIRQTITRATEHVERLFSCASRVQCER